MELVKVTTSKCLNTTQVPPGHGCIKIDYTSSLTLVINRIISFEILFKT